MCVMFPSRFETIKERKTKIIIFTACIVFDIIIVIVMGVGIAGYFDSPPTICTVSNCTAIPGSGINISLCLKDDPKKCDPYSTNTISNCSLVPSEITCYYNSQINTISGVQTIQWEYFMMFILVIVTGAVIAALGR